MAEQPTQDELKAQVHAAVADHLETYYHKFVDREDSKHDRDVDQAIESGQKREIVLPGYENIDGVEVFLEMQEHYDPDDTMAHDFLVVRTRDLVPLELLVEAMEDDVFETWKEAGPFELKCAKEYEGLTIHAATSGEVIAERLDSFFTVGHKGKKGQGNIVPWRESMKRQNTYAVNDPEPPREPTDETVTTTEGWSPARLTRSEFTRNGRKRLKAIQFKDGKGEPVVDFNALRCYLAAYDKGGLQPYQEMPDTQIRHRGQKVDLLAIPGERLMYSVVDHLIELGLCDRDRVEAEVSVKRYEVVMPGWDRTTTRGPLPLTLERNALFREYVGDRVFDCKGVADKARISIAKELGWNDRHTNWFGDRFRIIPATYSLGPECEVGSRYNVGNFFTVEARNGLFGSDKPMNPKAGGFRAYNEIRIPLPAFNRYDPDALADTTEFDGFYETLLDCAIPVLSDMVSSVIAQTRDNLSYARVQNEAHRYDLWGLDIPHLIQLGFSPEEAEMIAPLVEEDREPGDAITEGLHVERIVEPEPEPEPEREPTPEPIPAVEPEPVVAPRREPEVNVLPSSGEVFYLGEGDPADSDLVYLGEVWEPPEPTPEPEEPVYDIQIPPSEELLHAEVDGINVDNIEIDLSVLGTRQQRQGVSPWVAGGAIAAAAAAALVAIFALTGEPEVRYVRIPSGDAGATVAPGEIPKPPSPGSVPPPPQPQTDPLGNVYIHLDTDAESLEGKLRDILLDPSTGEFIPFDQGVVNGYNVRTAVIDASGFNFTLEEGVFAVGKSGNEVYALVVRQAGPNNCLPDQYPYPCADRFKETSLAAAINNLTDLVCDDTPETRYRIANILDMTFPGLVFDPDRIELVCGETGFANIKYRPDDPSSGVPEYHDIAGKTINRNVIGRGKREGRILLTERKGLVIPYTEIQGSPVGVR